MVLDKPGDVGYIKPGKSAASKTKILVGDVPVMRLPSNWKEARTMFSSKWKGQIGKWSEPHNSSLHKSARIPYAKNKDDHAELYNYWLEFEEWFCGHLPPEDIKA